MLAIRARRGIWLEGRRVSRNERSGPPLKSLLSLRGLSLVVGSDDVSDSRFGGGRCVRRGFGGAGWRFQRGLSLYGLGVAAVQMNANLWLRVTQSRSGGCPRSRLRCAFDRATRRTRTLAERPRHRAGPRPGERKTRRACVRWTLRRARLMLGVASTGEPGGSCWRHPPTPCSGRRWPAAFLRSGLRAGHIGRRSA